MSTQHFSFTMRSEPQIRDRLTLRSVASAKYEGDWNSIPHAHGYTELFYIVGGDGQFRIDNDLFPVRANQLVVVNPNIVHTEVSYEAHPLEYIVVGIEGTELSAPDNGDNRFCIFSFPEANQALWCMQNILRERQNRELEYETLCQAYMDILIVQIMRCARLSVAHAATGQRLNRQCSIIRHYIDTHYKERLTLDQLADQANANKHYLAHAFKKEYGTSPINYMISCRVREGKRLLLETDYSLTQIAHILGFSSASYFSQTFRRVEGMSPKEYRKVK